jgi:hypothetical protein
MGRRWVRALAALVPLSLVCSVLLGAPAPPAGAIPYDHGWTQWQNNSYPQYSNNAGCAPSEGGPSPIFCGSWSDDGAQHHLYPDINVVLNLGCGGCVVIGDSRTFEAVEKERMYNYIDGTNPNCCPFVDVGNANSPWLAENNTGGTTVVQWQRFDQSVAGQAEDSYFINQPPWNHGCCQQSTTYHATVSLNSNWPAIGYRDDGGPGVGCIGATCWHDVRYVYDHELQHAMGMGHTTSRSETMYPNWPTLGPEVIVAGAGDRNGLSCIYQIQNCG